ncbi:hypothetical protein B0H14DRAFT_344773 [Mycena olivaceomarginata]|nr:hypothetical protein B0H14DRAFT_344773 [Mycena olivaceomarginata]
MRAQTRLWIFRQVYNWSRKGSDVWPEALWPFIVTAHIRDRSYQYPGPIPLSADLFSALPMMRALTKVTLRLVRLSLRRCYLGFRWSLIWCCMRFIRLVWMGSPRRPISRSSLSEASASCYVSATSKASCEPPTSIIHPKCAMSRHCSELWPTA